MPTTNEPDNGYVITRDQAPRTSTAGEASPELSLQVHGRRQRLPLDRPRATLGSARECDVVLRDPYVSRRHASLNRRRGRIWIQDEGSRNGTWVNDLRVDRCELGVGAQILIGRTRCQLTLRQPGAPGGGIVGQHPSMIRVLEQVERYGSTRKPVLILGETGTGKELVARALHQHSSVAAGPFEPLNCGAIPRELAESELLGHAAGAFTGATARRQGAFERAHGGTLFLDEIGELPLELQPKLLRVLEDGHVRRLGDSRHRQIQARIVAATNSDLLPPGGKRKFRLDLYHRLAVAVIQLPPLRERAEDIPLLVRVFLNQCAGQGPAYTVDDQALTLLERRCWPGNVRELRNAVLRATMEGGRHLQPEDFSFLARKEGQGGPGGDGWVSFEGRPFDALRREVYQRVLDEHGGNRSAAGAALGIPKSTFFDQLRAMEL